MPIPFRVRHAEWIAGLFVLAAGAAVLVALLMLTHAKGILETHPVYYVTVQNGHGIAPGGPVKMLGIAIGTIEHVEITADRRVRARLEIKPAFAERIRADSEARIELSLGLEGMLAGVGFVVTPGSPEAEVLHSEAELPAREAESIADLLPLVADDPMLADIRALVHNARVLTDTIGESQAELKRALASATAVLEAVEKGDGTVGRLLHDDGELYDRLVTTMDKVDRTLDGVSATMGRSGKLMTKSEDLIAQADGLLESSDTMVDGATKVFGKMDPVMDEADAAMKDLGEAVRSFGKTTEQLGKLLVKMDAVVADMAQVAAATKKVWPIRRHLPKRGSK
jgi:ABC-type transporter Mla subunit MlaD